MRRSWTLGLLMAGLLLAAGCPAASGFDDDDDEGCEDSACGCLEEIYLEYEATVASAVDDTPLEGIALHCEEESVPVGSSDDEGRVRFNTVTYESDGCGLERCQVLRLHDPYGEFRDIQVDSMMTNGGTIWLQPEG